MNDFDEMQRRRGVALDELNVAFEAYEQYLRKHAVRVVASVGLRTGSDLYYGKIASPTADGKWCLYVKGGSGLTIRPLRACVWEERVAAAEALPNLSQAIRIKIVESSTAIAAIQNATATAYAAKDALAATFGDDSSVTADHAATTRNPERP